MKKFFSLLAVLALVSMAGTAFATPSVEGTKTAIATFTGGDISFSADLYNWNATYTGSTATNITWTTDGITLGSNTAQFKCADVYALIKSTITAASGKVWVYQDNRNNTDTKYKVASDKPRHDGANTLFSGLVRGNSSGGDGNFAPLAAYYRKISEAKTAITTLPTQFPPSGTGNYGVYWFKDLGDSDYTAKDPYTLVATSAGNFVGNGAYGKDYVKEDVVMFFGATFTNVLGGDTYGTNSITFVSEIE